MKCDQWIKWAILEALGMGYILAITACGISPAVVAPPVTSTPTVVGGGGVMAATPPGSNICDGLNGELEMQVLVGPADAVGLEPIAIGSIPFAVSSGESAYWVQGSGPISYQNVLEKEWGTYTVSFDMEADVSGTCEGDEQSGTLDLSVNASGAQNVEVRAEGFQGDYPWEGSQALDFSLPIEDGATAQGEGWAFVLHLNQ